MKGLGGFFEGIFVLIILFLVLSRSQGFAQVTSSLGQVGIQGVKALQGR